MSKNACPAANNCRTTLDAFRTTVSFRIFERVIPVRCNIPIRRVYDARSRIGWLAQSMCQQTPTHVGIASKK